MKTLYTFLYELFQEMELSEFLVKSFAVLICLLAIYVAALIIFYTTRKIVVTIVHKAVERSKTLWDDFFLERKVFSAISHLPSAFVFYFTYNFSEIPLVDKMLFRFSITYFILIASMVLNRSLNAAHDIYNTTPYAKNRPIKGYVQLLHILVYFISSIFIISAMAGKSPMVFIAGLSALAAVLLLVFKDTILGLTASIQLSANNMLKPGDWITMPSHNADGTVIDISLTTVKVQNWDKTITTIPTYTLVSSSFSNWTGMEESGIRRFKRTMNIDMSSVSFCNEELLRKFAGIPYIESYIREKQAQSGTLVVPNSPFAGKSSITNIGIFRTYLEAYLRNHPRINQESSLVVRYLQPTENGLPIEITAFSKDQANILYEALQSELIDHILSILPEFGLRIFQSPSGNDVRSSK